MSKRFWIAIAVCAAIFLVVVPMVQIQNGVTVTKAYGVNGAGFLILAIYYYMTDKRDPRHRK
ncbi:hypothetical protein IV38_GL001213 [Lactobacillus selangorensis]|uniref:Uncharacterized protein n=1 Tax=Lactobacillus selangorensis TaxID=81857 RepID=A0A0R2FW32_9LACO|nr:hypothetical protein [Lactobacillus selangorensis]KRN28999.1 hypothetical protein IV38_GL001213 [Lactobacillus selangorensis]KRN32591.1 hypothetical protein IV40_GL000640 [Lactobacillus selangorensis]